MVRWSMFTGWWELIRNPSTIFRRPSTGSEDFVMLSPRTLAAQQGQQMANLDAGLRRRSSGQVRTSVDRERELASPTTSPMASPGKGRFEEISVEEPERVPVKREEDVMV